jgi:hypothetical protein
MVPAGRQKLVLGGVRERQVSDVMAERRHAKNATPAAQLVGVRDDPADGDSALHFGAMRVTVNRHGMREGMHASAARELAES